MTEVSVIVPVYNGEKHLTECLDCICGQTLQNIEIICVDDGSTDSSLEILQQYQAQDERIQLYQQNHQYAGVARNLGKSRATGEYLAFWDCDDYFDKRALEKLYNKAKSVNADVCVCGGNRYSETRGKAYPFSAYLNMNKVPKQETFNRYTNPDHYLDFTTAVAWNKLFKRQYIEELALNFQPVRNGNDAYFTMCAIGLSERIAVLNERLVTYRINQNNGLTDTHDKDPLGPIQTWIDIAETLEKHDGFGERTFANRAIGNIIGLLSNLQNWDAFFKAMQALQDYGLDELHILYREKGYYYNLWDEKRVQHLWRDTPEQFAVFMAHSRFLQQSDEDADLGYARQELFESNGQIKALREENDNYQNENNQYKSEVAKKDKQISELKLQVKKAENENTKLTEEINRVRGSWTFKTGKVITWIPRKLKELVIGKGK